MPRAAVLSELDRLTSEVETLAAVVACQSKRLTQMRRELAQLAGREEERGRLQRLLPTLWSAIEGRCFTVADLLRADSGVERLALEAAAPSNKALGKLFERWQGEHIDFFTIRRLGGERDGAVWRVESDFAVPAKPANPLSVLKGPGP